MSWNSYIDNLLSSGNVKKAAICGHDGSLWAASEGWNVTPDEAKNLVTAFTNSSNLVQSGKASSSSPLTSPSYLFPLLLIIQTSLFVHLYVPKFSSSDVPNLSPLLIFLFFLP